MNQTIRSNTPRGWGPVTTCHNLSHLCHRSESSDARGQEPRYGDNLFGRRGRGFDSLLVVVGIIQRSQQPHPDELLAHKVRRESREHR